MNPFAPKGSTLGEFTAGAAQNDDLTLLVLEYGG